MWRSHSSRLNFSAASFSAAAYSSSEIVPGVPPFSDTNVSFIRRMISSRGRPVWLRSGSTRFTALVVPLSLSFSRPMRRTLTIFSASMS
ncbi:hypothetical protein D3C86_2119590 [compost metagenome]